MLAIHTTTPQSASLTAPLAQGRLGAAIANIPLIKPPYLYRHLFSSIRYKNFNLFYAYGIDFSKEITISLDGALTKTLYCASPHTADQLPAFENT